jgi:hypothetical protein
MRHHDQLYARLGSVVFTLYRTDIAIGAPSCVLETACGIGTVMRAPLNAISFQEAMDPTTIPRPAV